MARGLACIEESYNAIQQFWWRFIVEYDSIVAWQKPAHRRIWKDIGQARPKKWLRDQRTRNNRCRTTRILRPCRLRRDPAIPQQADPRAVVCAAVIRRLTSLLCGTAVLGCDRCKQHRRGRCAQAACHAPTRPAARWSRIQG